MPSRLTVVVDISAAMDERIDEAIDVYGFDGADTALSVEAATWLRDNLSFALETVEQGAIGIEADE